MRKKILIISELYYPESNATGYYLTGIAEGLAKEHDVSVICCKPTYDMAGIRVAKEERRNGVKIKRCITVVFNKNKFLKKVANAVLVTMSLTYKSMLNIKSNDIVMVVTNPPMLPHFISFICKIKKALPVMLVQDVYPDAMVAAGVIGGNSRAIRILKMLNRAFYKNIKHVVVLGRDMKELMKQYVRRSCVVHNIPNWGDLVNITPTDDVSLWDELGFGEKFVLQYAGNIGRTHDIDVIVEAAQVLKNENDIVFFIVGAGAKREYLERAIHEKGLKNIILKQKYPKERLNEVLNACDLAIISMKRGMYGVSVPSRMYNIMAAGKPLIGIVEEGSEIAKVIVEEKVGFVVKPGSPDQLVKVIEYAMSNCQILKNMGDRASGLVKEKYSCDNAIRKYEALINDCA